MSLDTIEQNARSIADAVKVFEEYSKVQSEQSESKKEQIRKYILRLSYNIQKCIDEERENI